MQQTDPLTTLKGIGPAVAAKFAVLKLQTVGDLIDYLPRRYEDFSHVTPVGEVQPGEVTVRAVIVSAVGRYVRRGMHVTEAVAKDDSGSVRLVWFNQPYRVDAIKRDQEYFVSGTFGLGRGRLSITNPSIELVSSFPLNTARVIPIYRETKGLSSGQIRAALAQTIPLMRQLPETLPDWLLREEALCSRAAAIEGLHFPGSSEAMESARYRLGFEEIFELVLASLLTKAELHLETSPAVPFVPEVARSFVDTLPFDLTGAQRRVVWRIYQDMERTTPMNRLVEGDVGAGKTVVAALAALMVLRHGYQAAVMAPTELLARQHADTLYKLLDSVGRAHEVGLLVGGMKKAQKDAARAAIAGGQTRLLVGTQALIQDSVDMHNLELIVIDEQHRFGVEQRKTLMSKAGHMPHVLSLTATPIPRTLALTLYGELDISVLDEKPAGRLPIITTIESPNSREQLNGKLDSELAAGRQMFVVCPLIEDSDKLEAASAEATYELFAKRFFKHRRVGLLHGRMKAEDKETIMQRFVRHELDILVSTTVIEVGVDVPNATVMLIEGADRFGLAQLHQLRGRIGRGQHQSYCHLMMSDSSKPGRRLQALERSQDGFKLAELDLELRGPGAIYGHVQHGQLDLRIARLSDTKLIECAREAAGRFLASGEDVRRYEQIYRNVKRLQAVTNLN